MQRIAKGLKTLGIAKGDRVLLLSENRPEWVISELAIITIGAIAVPAYTTSTTDDILYILDHSGACAAIVSSEKLARKLLPAARSAESCDTVISFDAIGPETQAGVRVLSWEAIAAMGVAESGDPIEWAATLKREEVCCFIYTSGTGGRPKGVMLTHGSLLANCEGAYDLLSDFGLNNEVFYPSCPCRTLTSIFADCISRSPSVPRFTTQRDRKKLRKTW